MNFNRIQQAFKPLFELDRQGAIKKTLTVILVGALVANGLYIMVRLFSGESLFGGRLIVNFILFIVHGILLLILNRGYVNYASAILILTGWVGMTYLAWMADGVRDPAVTVYILIILIAALITNWRVSVGVALFSIFAVWGLAYAEVSGLRTPMFESPYITAVELTAIIFLLIVFVYLVANTVSLSFKAVHQGEERFRKIFHLNPVAINVTALKDGRLIDANDAYWKLTGFERETSIGRTTVDLKIWDGEVERQKFVAKLLERKSLHNPSYEFINNRGEKHVTIAFYELIDSGDEPTILSIFYDITEQRATQLALQRSEARTRALLEAIPDMIFELKRDGTILQFIPSATNEPLLPPEEFIGKTIAQVLPSVAEQTAFAIDRALESGQLNAFEYQLQVGNESQTFEARITPAGPDLVLAMVRDVSLRKWAEAERENLIDELELKNAELERFTYTVSHDLKSPLITIRGFLGFVREDSQNGNLKRLDSDIQRISDATDRMHRLLGDLLELSRIGRLANKPSYIPMNTLVNEVLEFLYGRISSGNISVHVADNLPTVYGDRQRIFEVLQNLIDNAAKFMGDQVSPRIEIGQQGDLNGKPIFFVGDNGIGLAPEYKDKIFGLFDKLDPLTEGTGIGLALVKRIVEIHGGRIWVESEDHKGATFYFSLPSQPTPER